MNTQTAINNAADRLISEINAMRAKWIKDSFEDPDNWIDDENELCHMFIEGLYG